MYTPLKSIRPTSWGHTMNNEKDESRSTPLPRRTEDTLMRD